eukprot:2986542-Amphidinium_carterae.3
MQLAVHFWLRFSLQYNFIWGSEGSCSFLSSSHEKVASADKTVDLCKREGLACSTVPCQVQIIVHCSLLVPALNRNGGFVSGDCYCWQGK